MITTGKSQVPVESSNSDKSAGLSDKKDKEKSVSEEILTDGPTKRPGKWLVEQLLVEKAVKSKKKIDNEETESCVNDKNGSFEHQRRAINLL